jgi:hypothetical protein
MVMLEGKNDFYTLKYFHEKLLPTSDSINMLPGNGAGSLDSVIQLYIGWGRNFIVILDSDSTGDKEKKRYEDKFGILVEHRIYSLADVNSSWHNKTMETLIPTGERLTIQQAAYPGDQKYHKTHFNRAVQEMYLTGQRPQISSTTLGSFEHILDFCRQKLQEGTGVAG